MNDLIRECYCTHCGARNEASNSRCFACNTSLKATQPLTPITSVPLLKERYTLLERVGEGGFSTVYKARDTQTKQLVAIKAISLRGLSSLEKIEATDAFNREVKLLSQIKQAHVPQLHNHFSDAECWYLVMQFIDGITLEQYLARSGGHMPLEEVLDLGLLLCEVLAYLHSCQPAIIYRDLKPSNIMLTQEGHLFLVDFGIARRWTYGKAKDTIPFGSPGYAAPEQYGRDQTTERSDIYSLGAILHHLLSGHDPAQSPFSFSPLTRQGLQEFAQLDRLIQQMISLPSQQRPETIYIVKRKLEQIALNHRQFGAIGSTASVSSPVHQAYTPFYQYSISSLTPPTNTRSQKQIFSPLPPMRNNVYAIAGLICSLLCFLLPFIVIPFISWLIPLLHTAPYGLPDVNYDPLPDIFLWTSFSILLIPILSVILNCIGLHHAKVKPNLKAKGTWTAGCALVLTIVGLTFSLFYVFVICTGG